jgi:hypothetical protein
MIGRTGNVTTTGESFYDRDPGTYYGRVLAYDSLGNTGTWSETLEVTVI